MTRARSGSFYCPIPEQSCLSIAQKAEISTAHAPFLPSNNSSLVGGRTRRHSRTAAVSECFHHSIGVFPKPAPLEKPPSPLSNAKPPAHGEIHQVSLLDQSQEHPTTLPPASNTPMLGERTKSPARRHSWSPIRPSLLGNASIPSCPSSQWIHEQAGVSTAYRISATESLTHPAPSMLRSTLRSSFLSGPMAEKARMYGLRVAWCVYGDMREMLAKEIFVSGAKAGYSRRRSSASSTCSLQSDDDVEVVCPDTDVSTETRAAFAWSVQDPFSKQPFLGSVDETPTFSPMNSDEEDPEDSEDSEDSVSEYSTISGDSDIDPELSLDDLLECDPEFDFDFDVPTEQVV